MYYHKILKKWIIDPLDIFLLSSLFGCLLASYLKNYLSEEEREKRLKRSIIKKSELTNQRKSSLKKLKKIMRIYKVALNTRGGVDILKEKLAAETYQIATEIRNIVERLVIFLKKNELHGVAKIFFKAGRLMIELILTNVCNIGINYQVFGNGPSTQIIIFTTVAGATSGFIMSWLSAGAMLFAPPALLTLFAGRSFYQQVKNIKEALAFKELVDNILKEDEETRKRLKILFVEDENYTPGIMMKDPEELDGFKYDYEQFENSDDPIKDILANQLGLPENPTHEEIADIILKPKRKRKGKIKYFGQIVSKDFDGDNAIDVEFEKVPIKVKNN